MHRDTRVLSQMATETIEKQYALITRDNDMLMTFLRRAICILFVYTCDRIFTKRKASKTFTPSRQLQRGSSLEGLYLRHHSYATTFDPFCSSTNNKYPPGPLLNFLRAAVP